MKYAEILNGVVIAVGTGELLPQFAPPLQAVQVPAGVPASPQWLWDGNTFSAPPSPPAFSDRVQAAEVAIQARLDAEAQTRGYDGILSLCTYATSKTKKFQTEGQAGVNWRDAVWAYAYSYMADVQAGKQPEKTIPALLAALPAMVWP